MNIDQKIVTFSEHELLILNNALNEILNGPNAIEETEFHTRVGCSRDEAKMLLDKLAIIVDRIS